VPEIEVGETLPVAAPARTNHALAGIIHSIDNRRANKRPPTL
jgi:hypothetical protein